MKVPTSSYLAPERWKQEMDRIFHSVPLAVALSCDVRRAGEFNTLEIAGRPLLVVRGNDGVARTFLNVCRHRGALVAGEQCGSARRFTCPYHSWSYDLAGKLVGVPGQDTFGELDVAGLIELPTEEVAGLIWAVLSPEADIDARSWLGGMADALELLRLEELHRYPVTTELASPNWKVAADGYVDGYHIGFLHKDTIGRKSITNRNTYDFFGPHQRIGFANKTTATLRDLPEAQWDLAESMSLVHFLFPNVSIAGGLADALMVSRLDPGPTPDRSRTTQYQYFRDPVQGEEAVAVAEQRRLTYERVVRDEDYLTGFGITRSLGAHGDGHFRFGRNESGNQHLHRTVDALVDGVQELRR